MITVFLILAAGSVSFAEEQKEGQQLVFPKDQVEEHPSDLHMGSDPYYKKEKRNYEGSDEKGYPREYDPGVEYRESTTIKKKKTDSSEDQP